MGGGDGEADILFDVPGSCSHTAQGTFDFTQWGSLSADLYSCGLYNKMTCNLAVSNSSPSHQELQCTGDDPADPQGVPANCSNVGSGTRNMFDDRILTVTAYDCDYRHGLRCFYYVHAPNVCENVDSNANPADDCNANQDQFLLEEIQCKDP